jgi:TonB family protein
MLRTAAFLFALVALAFADSAPPSPPASPLLGADMPLYPPLARQASIQGRVEVLVQIGSDGKVISVKAKSGHPLLLQAALDNAKTWRFAPTRTEETLVYEFKIAEKAATSDDPYYKYGRIIFRPPNSVEIDSPPPIMVHD